MKEPRRLEADEAQLAAVAERLERRCLEPGDYALLKVVIDTVCFLSRLVRQKATSIQRLLRMIFGARTEKTCAVLHRGVATPPATQTPGEKSPRKGHGRRAANTYWGAKKVHVSHSQFKVGQKCPACDQGNLYDTERPSVLLHLQAQPVIAGTVFELEKLRCAVCGQLFSATPPVEAGQEKYAPNVAPMLAILRYGYGLPMNRMAQLQEDVGVPLPSGTQWELIDEHGLELAGVYEGFLRYAADGEIFFNDDTPVKILTVQKQIRQDEDRPAVERHPRTGVFTTGIVVKKGEHTLTLFFSGRRHAGENLQALLDRRSGALDAPIQMCDGLDRNVPEMTPTLLANCNTHGRRGFVEGADAFPEECAYVLETIQQVYACDQQAQTEHLSPEQRLTLHQRISGPLMEALKQWMERKLESHEVEPNSSLGEALRYELKHWEPLTLFLRVPAAPLDNNLCERALKMAIRHRTNSLFYKTEKGAHVGDVFMSLIHTCRLSRINPFDYLTTLRKYAHRLRDGPTAWMPWNYQATVAALAQP
jgi:transposase